MLHIRPATTDDLPGAYQVCLLTGDAGGDASAKFRDPELLGHIYVGPYVVGSPELALIVADAAGVAGYCLAVADTRAFESWEEARWWPALRLRYPPLDDGSPDAGLIGVIHHPIPAPGAVVAGYPAHLHIDLLERARGHGLGRVLIERQLADLRARGVAGVHLDVASDNANAIAFYRHLGFEEVLPLDGSILMGMRL
jgi:ribosomal protein S18 acetylase RimI-like enzyme